LTSNENIAASTFWWAMSVRAAGRPDEAAPIFASVTATNPYGYYGLRATDVQMGELPFVPPSGYQIPSDLDEGRAEAEQWLVQRFGLELPDDGALRADIASDSRLVRGQELWELGLLAEAREDFEAVRRDYSEDALASYQLAIYFRDLGLYRSSIVSARTVFRLAGTHPIEGPEFLARLTYPVYFNDLIIREAQENNLDPLYVFSLIWQESLFEGFAVSSASAQGLMQIWPPTGEDIAARIGWPDYSVAELQRPLVSVTFGTWLLREELNRFNHNPYAALAAYNGGPGNTQIWLDRSGRDYELFVEVITNREPQTYVMLIFEHYYIYSTLYGTE
jgi:soluble lytic murein transglycosylase